MSPRRGDLIRVIDLVSREDLNGKHGLVVGPPVERTERIPVCILGTCPIVGVNLHPKNVHVETDVPQNIRVQAWNDLGVAYSNEKMYSKSLEALEDGVRLAQTFDSSIPGVREETCRSLSNIVWLCLVMNKNGVDLKGKTTTSQVMEWAMRQIFAGVIDTLPKDCRVLFGAGKVPGRDTNHLIMTIMETEDNPRYFIVDEERYCVYEFEHPSLGDEDGNP
jgi:hypothetical protein